MTLLLDLGHTCAKLGAEQNGEVRRLGTYAIGDSALHAGIRECRETEEELRAVSVLHGALGEKARKRIEKAWGRETVWADLESARGNIRLRYANPETFGVDRLLALRAARQRTRSGCVVVDAGSALTVDGLIEDDRHCGGWIVPGYARQKSALEMLALPEESLEVDLEEIVHAGTAEAVESGVLRLLAGGIDAMCARLREGSVGGDAPVFLTGGDAERIQGWCRTEMILAPELVLEGLCLGA